MSPVNLLPWRKKALRQRCLRMLSAYTLLVGLVLAVLSMMANRYLLALSAAQTTQTLYLAILRDIEQRIVEQQRLLQLINADQAQQCRNEINKTQLRHQDFFFVGLPNNCQKVCGLLKLR